MFSAGQIARLMAWLVLEAHHLVLNGRAVAGAFALHPPAILGGLMQVGFYHGVSGGCGVRQMARQLWPLYMHLHDHSLHLLKATQLPC